jgi:uncharacterized membrane protein
MLENHSVSTKPSRIEAIDWIRGLVIVLMMLDHTRDFIHREALLQNPSDLNTTTPAVYLTRWLSHFCAPTFVFLAGLSAQLQLIRGSSRASLSRWLLIRGAFLIVLELIVLRPLIWFQLDFAFLAHLQVIWAIGWSMILLALLVWIPIGLTAVIAVVIVAGHNLLDWYPPQRDPGSWADIFWIVVRESGAFQVSWAEPWIQSGYFGGPFVLAQYPIVPWFGVMALGFVVGNVYRWPLRRRRYVLAGLGGLITILFVTLRSLNGYGDPNPWTTMADASPAFLNEWQWTLFSFLNTRKYPPSLLYVCMTIGPMLLLLALVDGRRLGWLGQRIIVFGSVPLFFYILQWPTVHLISRLLQWISGQPIGWDAYNPFDPRFQLPVDAGFGLGVVYLAWLLGLVALYPLCRWFRQLRRRYSHVRWLSLL